jgi:HEAT repeat protein
VLFLAPALAAAPPPDEAPRYAYTVISEPDRSYFPELSDNEYVSLDPGLEYYPYIFDHWPRTWLPQDYFSFSAATYAPDDRVEIQSHPLQDLGDPAARANTIYQLGRSGNPIATELLVTHLERERDDRTRADVLDALRVLNATASPVATPFLQAEMPALRLAAIRLHAIQKTADLPALYDQLLAEPQQHIRAIGLADIAGRPDAIAAAQWAALWEIDDPDMIATGIASVMRADSAADHRDRLSGFASNGTLLQRQRVAAHIGDLRDVATALALVGILLDDPHPSVRAITITHSARPELLRFQERLLELTRDADSEVRRAAAAALRHYPNRASFLRLVALTGDLHSSLTRRAAHASLEAIWDRYPVAEQLGDALIAENQDIRYYAMRLIAAHRSSRHNAAVQKQLPHETRPINIEAAIRALADGAAADAEADILTYHAHDEPIVRGAVAYFIGQLDVEDGYDLIRNYSLNDTSQKVRDWSVPAMGIIADPGFVDAMLEILQRTNYSSMSNPEFLSAHDRVRVMWGLTRMAIDKRFYKRLKQLVTDRVIKTPMGPAYDSDRVRVTACLLLAHHAKENGDDDARELADRLIVYLSKAPVEMGDPMGNPGLPPPARFYAYQARQYLDDKPMERRVVAPSKLRFNFRRVPKRLAAGG